MITEEKDLAGIWYNDEYLMAVENGRVRFNTNIDTRHKPFYTQNIFNEVLIATYEGDNKLRISTHIVAVEYAPGKDVIVIFFEDGRLIPARLVRFTKE